VSEFVRENPSIVRIAPGHYKLQDLANPAKPYQAPPQVNEILLQCLKDNGGNASYAQLKEKVKTIRPDLKNVRASISLAIQKESRIVREGHELYRLQKIENPVAPFQEKPSIAELCRQSILENFGIASLPQLRSKVMEVRPETNDSAKLVLQAMSRDPSFVRVTRGYYTIQKASQRTRRSFQSVASLCVKLFGKDKITMNATELLEGIATFMPRLRFPITALRAVLSLDRRFFQVAPAEYGLTKDPRFLPGPQSPLRHIESRKRSA